MYLIMKKKGCYFPLLYFESPGVMTTNQGKPRLTNHIAPVWWAVHVQKNKTLSLRRNQSLNKRSRYMSASRSDSTNRIPGFYDIYVAFVGFIHLYMRLVWGEGRRKCLKCEKKWHFSTHCTEQYTRYGLYSYLSTCTY